MNARYAKFVLALVGALGTFLVVVVEQHLNVVPAEWHPWVMLAYSLVVAFGVRQVPNKPPAGQRSDPAMSEQDRGAISAIEAAVLVVIVLVILILLGVLR